MQATPWEIRPSNKDHTASNATIITRKTRFVRDENDEICINQSLFVGRARARTRLLHNILFTATVMNYRLTLYIYIYIYTY